MIPVHEPVIGEEEKLAVLEALSAGEISGSFGRFIEEFEHKFAEYCDCGYGVAVSSGTAALHVAAVLAGIGPRDEVLISASTNIASVNAVATLGGVVVPIDSEPDTWCMDVRLLERHIGPRTKAIMPVHVYGHPVSMIEVNRLAKKHDLFVIEDCAEAHGATYRGHKVGSLGSVGCFSFYANKVITTGEGGMIVTDDKGLADRARSLRNLAFGKPRFMHEEIGYNYRMTNLQAGIGLAQLRRIERVISVKRRIAHSYSAGLSGVQGLRLPVEREYARNVYWMYCVVVDPEFGMTRDELATWLYKNGVDTRTMFCPMNLQPSLLKARAVVSTECPVAEDLWKRGMYLPSGCALRDAEIDNICALIREARCA